MDWKLIRNKSWVVSCCVLHRIAVPFYATPVVADDLTQGKDIPIRGGSVEPRAFNSVCKERTEGASPAHSLAV